jgi:hypothetical protein
MPTVIEGDPGPGPFMCARCVSDEHLKRFIRENAVSRECDFCGRHNDSKPIAADAELVSRRQEPWLSGPIQPIPGLPDSASIVMVYPFKASYAIRGWAWWDCGIWVGPRHTNYGDGSICAFEPTDPTGIWRPGDPLLQLLHYWASWLGRHIYLTRLGRWPGPQSLHTAFERINEHRPHEMCGCGSGEQYAQCCHSKDVALPTAARQEEFSKFFPWPFRQPPKTYQDCMRLAMQPPVSAGQIRARQQLPRMLRTPYPVR